MSNSAAVRRALIVHAHPESRSFSTAQMATAAQALRDAGYAVDVLDLYAEGWAPVLGREDFAGTEEYFKPQAEQRRAVQDGTLAPRIRHHLELLLAADLLVLSAPLWWFSLPAVLKGWVDRVFVMGGVFGGDHGVFDEGALVGKRAMLLLTTGGSRESFRPGGGFGALDDFLFHIHRGMFEFVGYEAVQPVVTYGPARLTAQERAAALDSVRESVALVAAGSPVTAG
ncbi:NAD(P)H-dependent oxidoreductase [Streptomyces sp. NPDC059070]|uniref:NAD(P)H-dependent oxidoreductase n=1 Tax=unclassified Streptomyces TaxID=2593676 RepID=UPI0034E26E6E